MVTIIGSAFDFPWKNDDPLEPVYNIKNTINQY